MVALHYETSSRLFVGLELVNSDLEFICEHYFDHVNYYRVDGRPVVFVHVTQKL